LLVEICAVAGLGSLGGGIAANGARARGRVADTDAYFPRPEEEFHLMPRLAGAEGTVFPVSTGDGRTQSSHGAAAPPTGGVGDGREGWRRAPRRKHYRSMFVLARRPGAAPRTGFRIASRYFPTVRRAIICPIGANRSTMCAFKTRDQGGVFASIRWLDVGWAGPPRPEWGLTAVGRRAIRAGEEKILAIRKLPRLSPVLGWRSHADHPSIHASVRCPPPALS